MEAVAPESDAPSLFDPPAAHRAKADGIARADSNANTPWKEAAMDAVRFLAKMRITFTADDVWLRLEDSAVAETHQPSALGPIFMRAAREGIIYNTHTTVPTKIARRHREITVWGSVAQ